MGRKTEAPKLRIVIPARTQAKPANRAPSPGNASSRREVNYLAIDPSPRCVCVHCTVNVYVWVPHVYMLLKAPAVHGRHTEVWRQ